MTKKLPAKAQTALSYDALKAAYANTTVPAQRYGFVAAQKLLHEPILQVLPPVAASGDAKAALAVKAASVLA